MTTIAPAVLHDTPATAEPTLRSLLTPFARSQDRRAWFQLLSTALLLVAGWSLMAYGVRQGWSYGLLLLLALPVAPGGNGTA